jgi:hypothetical protein
MSSLDEYVSACLPAPRTIAGVRVRPHSLGAALLLHRVGSPFVDLQNKNPGAGDCLLALFILSRPFAEAAVALNSTGCKAWMDKQSKRLLKSPVDHIDLQIAGHIAQGGSAPRFWPGSGRQPGAPTIQVIKITLLAKLGFTETEALDMPLAQANWDYCAFWEMEGGLKLYNEEDLALIEANKQLRASIAARPGMTAEEFLKGGTGFQPVSLGEDRQAGSLSHSGERST